MTTLFPDDDPDLDSVEQRCIRIASSVSLHSSFDPEIRHSELESILKKLDPNKAPGIDSLDNKIIKRAWGAAGPEIVDIFNRCLRTGHFPKVWKVGKLKVIPKSNGRSLSDPKFYRPITLLPAFGKLLERVLAARLLNQLSRVPVLHAIWVPTRSIHFGCDIRDFELGRRVPREICNRDFLGYLRRV